MHTNGLEFLEYSEDEMIIIDRNSYNKPVLYDYLRDVGILYITFPYLTNFTINASFNMIKLVRNLQPKKIQLQSIKRDGDMIFSFYYFEDGIYRAYSYNASKHNILITNLNNYIRKEKL